MAAMGPGRALAANCSHFPGILHAFYVSLLDLRGGDIVSCCCGPGSPPGPFVCLFFEDAPSLSDSGASSFLLSLVYGSGVSCGWDLRPPGNRAKLGKQENGRKRPRGGGAA